MPDVQCQRWELHGLVVEGHWDQAAVGERWVATFAPRPAPAPAAPTDLSLRLSLASAVPPAPARPPAFQQGELLSYYVTAEAVVAHFPRFGQLRLDLAAGTTTGEMTSAALATHGVFEDLLAISLSPHLRRRGRYLLHAFAAAPRTGPAAGRAALIIGDIGAGKTTTGLALLHAGWQLLSNDSPILAAGQTLRALAYPGLLSAYPDTLARFPELAALVPPPAPRQKTLFAAEAVYPAVWLEDAPPGALLLPRIEPRAEHALERLEPPDALRQILPHAIEQWDRAAIPAHLALLTQLVQTTPAYRLRLAPYTETLPDLIASALQVPHHQGP
jgi:hypothetical protein